MGDRRANPPGISGHLLLDLLADSAGLFLSRRSLLQPPPALALVPPPDCCTGSPPHLQQEFWGAGGAPSPSGAACFPSHPAAAPARSSQPSQPEETAAARRLCAIAMLHGNLGEVSCPVISSTVFKFPGHVSELQQLS